MPEPKYDPVKFREIEMRVEALDRHEKKFEKRLDDIDISILSINANVLKILNEIKGIPESVKSMELEKAKNEGYINAFKIATGIIIGLIISYAVKNSVIANKEEKEYKYEVSK